MSQVMVPRPAQVDMGRGLLKAPRTMLIASMGLGKTGALLLHAKALAMYIQRWPGVLVFAPLQVAFNWRKEIQMWLPGLRVAIIAGEEADRRKILLSGADITICTYDHIPWLDAHTNGHSWRAFGEMVFCDESTKIKETRVATLTSSLGNQHRRYNGGVQTNALAKHAEDVPYWVNATGTPTPNGLVDVWGQYWYVDGGLRLGPSYTRFEQAYFMLPTKRTEFAKPIPIPGSMEAISKLTADVTVVARVEDYYPDLAEPNIIDRYVELPAKARKVYTDMKNRMSAEVRESQTITVQTAGAKIVKCLQIASGFAYFRDEDEDPDLQLCEELHNVKLDAVDSILNETGESLVVVYFFKATLQMLRKRYKKRLVELDKNGKAQDQWNAGKAEILAIQYSAGSLGLSLQHGGRNICLLTPTYRADDYAQILERLGPLRQLQSGYNRVVNVFRVIAHGTEDARVFDVPIGKITAEQAMVEFMQELTQ